MNLKNKLFAGFTALSLVISALSPVSFVSNVKADSAEDMMAYEWAFDSGLTTMTSFSAFMFENAITREQAARFLVKGAEALGIELSSDQECDYKDLGTADQSLVEFINEGCELGIFKAQDDFNPKQLLTRGQAELTVARVVYGFDEVAAYADDADISEFAAARELLMADDIVKMEVPADSAVRRGHLLLMLYRLADAEITDPGTPTAPGHAEVSLVSSAGNQEVPYNAVGVKVGTIKLTAGENATKVASVVVSRDGLGQYSDIDGVWLANANTVTKSYKVTSANTATVRFSPALELAAGTSQTFDVLVALKNTATSNSTHNFKVSDVNVSNGTASGAPVNLGTVKTTSYAVKTVSAVISANDVDSGKTGQDVATVTLNPADDATVKGFVLNQIKGSGYTTKNLNEVFANVKVYYNDAVVGSATVTSDKIVVSGLNISADNGDSVELELKADVIYVGSSADYGLSFDNKDFSALTVLDKASGYGMRLDAPASDSAQLSDFDITLTKVANATTIAPATSSAVLYQATLKSATDFTITSFHLKDVFSGDLNAFTNGKVTLYVDGVAYELFATDYNGTFDYNESNEEIYIDAGRTVTIKVVGSTKAAAQLASVTDKTFQFEFSIDGIKNSDNDVVSISIARKGDKFNIKAGTATVKTATVAAPTSKTLYSNADNQEIGRFAVKAEDEDLKLKTLTLDATSTTTDDLDELLSTSDVKLIDLTNNTEVSATVELNGDTIVFKSMNYNIAKGATSNFKVTADFGDITAENGNTVKLAIDSAEFKNSSATVTVTSPSVTFVEYTFGVQPPVVTLAKLDDDRFKVTIRNNDAENSIDLLGIKARIQILSNDSDYTGTALLNLEGSSVTEGAGDASSQTLNVPGAASYFNLSDEPTLSEDGGEISYEIYVNSSYINPAVLKASITELTYQISGTTGSVIETYNVSAQ